jgi:glycosyltransferase involved in cell wall biosynthesis
MSRQSIELQMIVKNESVNLARCLRSIRDVVDRIVIGDTGSTDDTAAIARSFRAEIISVPWNGDFAAARNAVLRHSRCDWILVLDADEMLDANGAQALAKATQQPEPAAYDVCRWNYVLETHSHSGEHGALRNPGLLPESSSYPAYVKSINTRLFRRHPEVFFERPVHERVVYRLQKLQLPIAAAPFLIHHFGHTEDAKPDRARKNEIYYQIGMRHLEKNPDDARTCFELGLVELDYFKKPEAALSFFLRALQLNQQDSEPWIFAGVCLVRMQKYVEAIELLSHAAKLNPHSIVLQESLGAGIPLALGSDGPMNPYLNIMLAAVDPGRPSQAITREQAVIAYTLTSAYAEFAEKEKGSLEPGKLADLAVLSQDIFTVSPPDLPKTASVLTLVGGKVIYDAKVISPPPAGSN